MLAEQLDKAYVELAHIKVAEPLYAFINKQVLPGLTIEADAYWQMFDSIISNHHAQNMALLEQRDQIQQQIDDWHHQHAYDQDDLQAYKQFLRDIDYLLDEGPDFQVDVNHVDREIATVAGPQLVVPINNARYAINAANARWGSLYDALYGTDMIADAGDTARTAGYNEQRGEQVFEFCTQWLDQVLPLHNGSHADIVDYNHEMVLGVDRPVFKLANGQQLKLIDPEQFRGYRKGDDLVLLFSHHDLHFELQIDHRHPIGQHHPAGVKDIILEAAVTTIQDCEDSVTAVDVEDKLLVYRNWLELIKGSLSVDMSKGEKSFTRRLNPNREYYDPAGKSFELSGRSLMLVRNTGLHMQSELVLMADDSLAPEGLVDALVTILISMHDLGRKHTYSNSHAGSIYIVKPKMHGPQEVAFSCQVFADIEQAYGLPPNTVKIGIMDEERRTTVNLKECIRQARERVIFINTGFLDRTGDEIHTSMEAGAMLPKAEIKRARWIDAYENWNVDIGLACGLAGQGQIGKGMWAVPDQMRQMYDSKQAHPQAGANCAWVPSPTAATIHALHYHQVDVKQVQQQLAQRPRASIDDILSIPLLPQDRKLDAQEIQQELDNNAQGILGYVVKWIDMGIGCSKVPDIHDTGLMEDRATLRISSQHMANWLRQGLCDQQQVIDTFQRMAQIVDKQNAATPGYRKMAPEFDGIAFQAAVDLVLEGTLSANGYTEQLLHQRRRRLKQA
ncbi:MAG: malate synthase G [Gammaproteobacteria bacterium]|nr:malate synthase G [Gammaproteobacteria bacterium]